MKKIVTFALVSVMAVSSVNVLAVQKDYVNLDSDSISATGDVSISESINSPVPSNFYYCQEGNDLYVSFYGTGSNESGVSNIIIGAYDNDVLVKSMVIPLDSAVREFSLDEFKITLEEEPQNLAIKAFMWSADGECEPYYAAAELSNIPADCYICYGRVLANSRAGWLDSDEVVFNVELSDNFNGYEYGPDAFRSDSFAMSTGDTDLNDSQYLFRYIKAYVIHDKLSDELTIIDYTTNVCNESIAVNMKLNDVIVDKYGIPAFGEYEINDDAMLYVNGVEYGEIEDVSEIININQYDDAKVTLVDSTEECSTEGDGVYDYALVECYAHAVVDSVVVNEETATVYFSENSDDIEHSMNIDLTDEDIYLRIKDKNGNISESSTKLADLKESDTLYIAYDFWGGFEYSEFFDIITDGELVQEHTEIPEFAINNIISNVSALINDGKLCIGGSMTIDRTTVGNTLSAVINVYNGAELAFTKTINVPAQMKELSFNESVEYGGAVDSAEIVLTDGETVYYTENVPVTDAMATRIVRGRVIKTSKTDSSLAENQVIITDESDYYREKITVYTDVEFAILYEYCDFCIAEYDDGTEKIIKAEVLKDTTVTFGTNEVSDEFDIARYGKISVYKSEDSFSTIKYGLEDEFELYVNGVKCADSYTNTSEEIATYIEQYIYNNPTGQVTLLDCTYKGSTASNGKYDYIFVTCTDSAVVFVSG